MELAPGEEKEISFALDKRAFAYYEERIHGWYVESGDYGVEIAASSRDIRLSGTVHVDGTAELPYHYTLQSSLRALEKTAKGRVLLERLLAPAQGSPDAVRALYKMSLESLTSFGALSREQLEAMVSDLNTADK